MERTTEIHHMEWNGLLLEITYEPDWLPVGIAGWDLGYIRVYSIKPAAAPLPIGRGGFYSDYIPAAAIKAAGGPVNYVDVILEAETIFPGERI